ncbi:MAG: DUF1583 domain-containing protein [Planctomyces sp.]|nr:DUF1583 domain-containing protein [Planctomyces sp.]
MLSPEGFPWLRLLRIVYPAWIAVVLVQSAVAATDPETSKDTAFSRIFSDQMDQSSARDICQQATLLSPDQRFHFLRKFVIPESNVLRFTFEFTPTHPAPPVDPDFPQTPPPTDHFRVSHGGQLVSPVLELVDAAQQSAQLDELLRLVTNVRTDDLLELKKKTALMILILMAQNSQEAAFAELDQFSNLSAQEQPFTRVWRTPELILFERCMHHPDAHDLLISSIDRMVTQLQSKGTDPIWSRMVRSRRGQQFRDRRQQNTELQNSSQWHPHSQVSAESRGMGLPSAQWKLFPGRAENPVSHGNDFLYFASPLQGSYSVECDATAFNWSELRIFSRGIWVNPIYDHQNYEFGGLVTGLQRRPIHPKLTKINQNLHLRTRVTASEMTSFVNGRPIHRHEVTETDDPWVGVRSGHVQEGTAFDLRVTGSPQIPASINLCTGRLLDGWLPYFDHPIGVADSNWRGQPGGILGAKRSAEVSVPSCFHEEAVFYHRPMMENGTIEYEFFYQENQACAHPALDRLCMLMKPDGVAVHWLTDGRWERTELAPDNQQLMIADQQHQGRLPLIQNFWNTASLTLKDGTIQLRLNGEAVFKRPLEFTNQRLFGFFYYADQEELRVRNVQWTGDWPKSLPDLQDQYLAVNPEGLPNSSPEETVRSAQKMNSEFEYDFAKEGIDPRRLTIIQGAAPQNFEVLPSGVRAFMKGPGGYRNTTLAPAISIAGDFDATVEYDLFESDPAPKGGSSVMLIAMLQKSTQDEALVMRRHMFSSEDNNQHVVQCATVRRIREGEQREHFISKPMEERSGRLKLCRRGSEIHYFTAEGDSPNFRHWASRDFGGDPVSLNGLRLVLQVHEQGTTSVLWKKLHLRAEGIFGPGAGGIDERLVELNRSRSDLPVRFNVDLSKTSPDPADLYRWGDLRPWSIASNGLPILAQGDVGWTSSGIATRVSFQGDFDVHADFDQVKFAQPTNGQNSGIFLQVDFADDLETQVSAIYSITDTGTSEMAGQIRTRKSDGEFHYHNFGRISVTNVRALRLARRGTLLTVIGDSETAVEAAASSPSSQATETPNLEQSEQIVGQIEVGNSDVRNAKILLHTGGPDRTSEMVLKNFEVWSGDKQAQLNIPDAQEDNSK